MSLTAFFIAALALAITPGPGIAYVVARTVAGGRAEGMASCMGTAIGGFVHVLAAAAGLSLILAESALAFSIIKYLGAAYLIYLGINILRNKPPGIDAGAPVRAMDVRSALREGILVEALNVKTALFFLAFLPQFVTSSEPLIPQFLLLGTICVLLNAMADVAAVLTAHRLLDSAVAHAARARLMTKISGVTMIGLGVLLATARRQS